MFGQLFSFSTFKSQSNYFEFDKVGASLRHDFVIKSALCLRIFISKKFVMKFKTHLFPSVLKPKTYTLLNLFKKKVADHENQYASNE